MSELIYFPKDGKGIITRWKVKKGVWVEKGNLIALYKISSCGKIGKLKATTAGRTENILVKENQEVNAGDAILQLIPCSHSTVMRGMCAECGVDLRGFDVKPASCQQSVAKVAMIHSVPDLVISVEEAQTLGDKDKKRLLKSRKLALLVDLDQTIIHTTNEDVPPNLKDVHHFQMNHAPPSNMWYHTKFRPFTKDFLAQMSDLFELHVISFGVHYYAHTITRIMDPEYKYFSDRILSRDECFDPLTKTANLKALFPCGDQMVCIIDDREEVWNFIPNLIHVKPYFFFDGTGDINTLPGMKSNKSDENGDQNCHRKSSIVRVPKNGSESEKSLSSKPTEHSTKQNVENLKNDDEAELGKSCDDSHSMVVNSKNDSEKCPSLKLADHSNEHNVKDLKNEDGSELGQSCDDSHSMVVNSKNGSEKSPSLKFTDNSSEQNVKDLKKDDEADLENVCHDSHSMVVNSKNGSEKSPSKLTDHSNEQNVKDLKKDDEADLENYCHDSHSMVVNSKNGSEKSPSKKSPSKHTDHSSEQTVKDLKKDDEADLGKSCDDSHSVKYPCDSGNVNSVEVEMNEKIESHIVEKKCESNIEEKCAETNCKKELDCETNGTDSVFNSQSSDVVNNLSLQEKNAINDKEGNSEKYDEYIVWEDNDLYLKYLAEVLTRIHAAFYELHDQAEMKKETEMPDLKNIIPYVRKKTLKGVRILFSGIFPLNSTPHKFRAYIIAEKYGAVIHNSLISKEESKDNFTTHIIAAQDGTSKVKTARKLKYMKIVRLDWLYECAERWEHCSEDLFPLPKKDSQPPIRDHYGSHKKRKSSSHKTSPAKHSKSKTVDNNTKSMEHTNNSIENDQDDISSIKTPFLTTKDINEMYKECEDIMNESSSSNSNSDEEVRNKILQKMSESPESSSDDSLQGDSPKGWYKKRRKNAEYFEVIDEILKNEEEYGITTDIAPPVIKHTSSSDIESFDDNSHRSETDDLN